MNLVGVEGKGESEPDGY